MAARNDSVQVMVRLRPSDNPAKELVVQPDGKVSAQRPALR